MDWLSPRWCTWLAKSSYIHGAFLYIVLMCWCSSTSSLWFDLYLRTYKQCNSYWSYAVGINADLCRWQDHHVCLWEKSKHQKLLWWLYLLPTWISVALQLGYYFLLCSAWWVILVSDHSVHLSSGHISFTVATSERHNRVGRKETERGLF